MSTKFNQWLLACIGSLLISASAFAQSTSGPLCQNQFPNFITDICWDCVFPFSFFGGVLKIDPTGSQENFSSGTQLPVCACGLNSNGGLKVGAPVGFWEMSYLVDVHTQPGCMPFLGGVQLPIPYAKNEYGKIDKPGGKQHRQAFRHANYYVSPMMYLMGAVLDDACADRSPFDVGWMSELDPTWNDDQLALIKMPISFVFGSIPAQLAGAIDAAASQVGFPINQIFWQAGAWGPMYPVTGNVQTFHSADQNARLVVTRMLAEAHDMREMAGLFSKGGGRGYGCEPGEANCSASTTNAAQCAASPSAFPISPILPKRQYKYSRTFPLPQTNLILGSCCQPIGRTTIPFEYMTSAPLPGYKDFGFTIFRKRDCCSGYNVL